MHEGVHTGYDNEKRYINGSQWSEKFQKFDFWTC
jgi:hypothetical protein